MSFEAFVDDYYLKFSEIIRDFDQELGPMSNVQHILSRMVVVFASIEWVKIAMTRLFKKRDIVRQPDRSRTEYRMG